jgi:hypothetical protein
MSAAEGSKEFKIKLKEALAKSQTYRALQNNYRQKLNTENIHILDLSYNTLMVNAVTDDQKARFPASYELFKLSIEKAKPPTYANLTEFSKANPKLLVNNEVVYITDKALLICANFKAGRLFITNKISRNIPSDEFFGISNRARGIGELRAEGYEVFPTNKEEHETDPVNYKGGWRVRSGSGKLRTGDRYFNNEGLELDRKDRTKVLIRELSNLDLGHLYTKNAKDAPLGFKLSRLLNVESISGNLKTVVESAIENLMGPPEACIDFNFENLLPQNYKQAGTLLLRLEFFKLNGEKAFIETGIYNKVREEIVSEIKKDLLSIPGSNTMLQDFFELIENGIVAELSGKSRKKLKPHSPVIGTLSDKPKSKKVKTGTQTLKLGSTPPAGKLNSTPSTTNLIKLQNLINSHLQDVVAANMGDGSQRRILNYRTGRFAGSVKVEKMSQSREGMITAFYSYMRNPYQTFEPGFRQGSPKTRDPKLLIAKSIREIAETSVANRMRAVSI